MDTRRRRDSRSRSPVNDHSRHARHSSQAHRKDVRYRARASADSLPYGARQLTKHDLDFHRPMFALYLDIQKRRDIEELPDDEVKGRWKSFLNKWNRGDLAEGWYDPATLMKARNAESFASGSEETSNSKTIHTEAKRGGASTHPDGPHDEEEDNDDDFGPAPPTSSKGQLQLHPYASSHDLKAGPTIPTYQDIQSRNEDMKISEEVAREQQIEQTRRDRKIERKIQESRLDEIAPRAEAGTRERQLEKKREIAISNRAFAASKDAGGDIEIRDSDLMGGDDLGELKRMKKEQDRRKTEREIKREEILRARMAERGQKLKAIRDKEEKTMRMLREIARDRFGDGNVQPATLKKIRCGGRLTA